ncbi:hypothetical protein [Streptomyces sp. NPDC007856]|uniref:hypothetical protein n=1 Tax=Streptomyces sp. NPDC007856 TaxID=3364781 RepID=UPI0036802700
MTPPRTTETPQARATDEPGASESDRIFAELTAPTVAANRPATETDSLSSGRTSPAGEADQTGPRTQDSAWNRFHDAEPAKANELLSTVRRRIPEASYPLGGHRQQTEVFSAEDPGRSENSDRSGIRPVTGTSTLDQAALDDAFGPAVKVRKVKDGEFARDEEGNVVKDELRVNPLFYRLEEFESALLERTDGKWLYVVDENGEILLGSEDVTSIAEPGELDPTAPQRPQLPLASRIRTAAPART